MIVLKLIMVLDSIVFIEIPIHYFERSEKSKVRNSV